MSKTFSAFDIFQQIQSKQRKAVEVLDETYDGIQESDARIGAYVSLTKELAYETAQSVDKLVQDGKSLPLLAGVPIAIKDNLNIESYPTTCS
ncbi:MAG: Asp-tRNA(Asn)/Glu-tRNA(Gln) amidotransferase subunit GatA, partial [Cyanobacteria bacterium]|nr:Asp-tRNA(Asn)/Glu-tRNA(Gln) amidotransferase subunit GatA [Cyanobacteriota bacterium]